MTAFDFKANDVAAQAITIALGGKSFIVEQFTVNMQMNCPCVITCTTGHMVDSDEFRLDGDFEVVDKLEHGDSVSISMREEGIGVAPKITEISGVFAGYTTRKIRHIRHIAIVVLTGIGELMKTQLPGITDVDALPEMKVQPKTLVGASRTTDSVKKLIEQYVQLPKSVTWPDLVLPKIGLPLVARAVSALYTPGSVLDALLAAISAGDLVYSPSLLDGMIIPRLPVYAEKLTPIREASLTLFDGSANWAAASDGVRIMDPCTSSLFDTEYGTTTWQTGCRRTYAPWLPSALLTATDTCNASKLRVAGYYKKGEQVDETNNTKLANDETILALIKAEAEAVKYAARTGYARGDYALVAHNLDTIRPGFQVAFAAPYTEDGKYAFTGSVVAAGFTVGQKETPASWIILSHLRSAAEQTTVSTSSHPLYKTTPSSLKK